MASLAATRASWLTRSRCLALRRPKIDSASKPGTSAAMRTGNSLGSNRDIFPTPDRPACRPSQVADAVSPSGLTIPTPVITTRREGTVSHPTGPHRPGPVRSNTCAMSATAGATKPALNETVGYRLKRRLLGPPMVTEQLEGQRLSNPIAMGVLSCDMISSSAYGTEEMLTVLVPTFGLAAFTLVLPVTFVILGILILVTFSYREVVMVYTKAGGSYVVSRENFGLNVAQFAAVALLIDYTLTVAVQVAAGTAALTSAIPSLNTNEWIPTAICVAVVLLLMWGNLRGIREAGRTFAFPTYFFIASMALVVVIGLAKEALGTLPMVIPKSGHVPIGHNTNALVEFGTFFVLLRAFANGGSSLTGLEAISNSVSAFKAPEGINARKVLGWMSFTLGSLVLGVSLLAHFTHAIPYSSGSPTVISQVAHAVVRP